MSRHAARKSTLGVALSLGKSAAQVTAQFAPVPGMAALGEVLCVIMVLCQNVSQNRNAAYQLQERSYRLALAVLNKVIANENVASAVAAVLQSLQQIQARMEQWSSLGNIKAFLRQQEIAKDIEYCHNLLTDCFTTFQLQSQLETHDWQSQLKLDNEQDQREVVEYLTNLQNSQNLIHETMQVDANDHDCTISYMKSGTKRRYASANVHDATGRFQYFQTSATDTLNLYDLQANSQELLPDFHLRRGEVIRIGQFPISGTTAMVRLYLQREKVAIKVVRAVNSDEQSLRRFKRECEIWKDVWKIDQGKHVLPFYGFCQEDGPFPYMVSPWMQKDVTIDYIRLVKGIAKGIQVLHSMSPPVVHGDIKASNIVVDSLGNPLIADFGLSRIVEDITGIPFSQSRGVSDSYRWFAPEVCIGQGVLSLSSDVYAYGMTVLELFTHSQPFNEIKHTTEVVIRSARGEQPSRPMDRRVLDRGLNDYIWDLLRCCWTTEASQRPTIEQVRSMYP
ncbi:kinase-like domain-containing protein [Mycena amicta]|nr:kinase-like domain-containing protein [Mycena amicta]